MKNHENNAMVTFHQFIKTDRDPASLLPILSEHHEASTAHPL